MKIIEKTLELPLQPECESLFAGQRPLFLDIETTGLSAERSRLYLVGSLHPLDGESWKFTQWLAESPFDERELLRQVCAYVRPYSPLVHFNGNHFDLPYLQKRCEENGLEGEFLQKPSRDLYRDLKPCQKLFSLPNARQKSFEQFLGLPREDTYDGGRLIPVYHEYVRTGSNQLERLLLLHNEEDVIGMAQLLPLYAYAALLRGDEPLLAAAPSPIAEPDAPQLLLSFPLRRTYPVRLSLSLPEGWYGVLNGQTLRLALPSVCGELRRYLPNHRDYYYLPLEDTVVHKSVGQYVDRAYRQSATRENCFLKKDGLFFRLPEKTADAFFADAQKKTPFGEWTKDILGDADFWESYLRQLFQKF